VPSNLHRPSTFPSLRLIRSLGDGSGGSSFGSNVELDVVCEGIKKREKKQSASFRLNSEELRRREEGGERGRKKRKTGTHW